MSNSVNNENPIYPKPLEEKFERVFSPFQNFIGDQTSGSILLIICALIAPVIGNSPLAHDYESLIDMRMGLIFG